MNILRTTEENFNLSKTIEVDNWTAIHAHLFLNSMLSIRRFVSKMNNLRVAGGNFNFANSLKEETFAFMFAKLENLKKIHSFPYKTWSKEAVNEHCKSAVDSLEIRSTATKP